MKRVFRERDKYGGLLEVNLLDRNNQTPNDLIYVRLRRAKRKGKKRRGIEKELGFVLTAWEAFDLMRGLFLGIDEFIDRYKLEQIEIKTPKKK